jgi:dTDP-glucose 4,6-dehydratase
MRPEKSEVQRLWASNTKAKELLNWKPKYESKDGFMKALKITADWFSDPVNLGHYKIGQYTV